MPSCLRAHLPPPTPLPRPPPRNPPRRRPRIPHPRLRRNRHARNRRCRGPLPRQPLQLFSRQRRNPLLLPGQRPRSPDRQSRENSPRSIAIRNRKTSHNHPLPPALRARPSRRLRRPSPNPLDSPPFAKTPACKARPLRTRHPPPDRRRHPLQRIPPHRSSASRPRHPRRTKFHHRLVQPPGPAKHRTVSRKFRNLPNPRPAWPPGFIPANRGTANLGCVRCPITPARPREVRRCAQQPISNRQQETRQERFSKMVIISPASQKTAQIRFTLNGEQTDVSFAPYKTLLEVLREDLNHTGTKHGCELGECGACAVLLDGKPVLSCLLLALECNGKDVLTVEGLGTNGALHPLQETFADLGAAQCGYCTPAILVTAKALLDQNPHPTRDQIREALSGNLCRCTGYLQIFEAVEAAVLEIAGQNKAAG